MEDELLVLEDGKEVTREQTRLLVKRIEELKLSNEALLAENFMFERFIDRLDLPDPVSVAGGDAQRTTGNGHLEGGAAGRRCRSRFNASDRHQLLTSQQKVFVALREITETQHEQETLRLRYVSLQENHKVSVGEAELCRNEIRKIKSKFESGEYRPARDQRREKNKVAPLRTFTLRNHALRVQARKLRKQLQQKKELEKADNQEIYMDYTAQTCPKHLDELQIRSLKAQRLLSSHMEKLQSVITECAELSVDIAKRRQLLARTEEGIRNVEEECLKAESLNKHLQQHLEDYGEGPDTMAYFHMKEKHKKLKRSVNSWERKIGIVDVRKAS
ncbi:unnamed protein product [Ophioblennius macclurei]